MKRISQKSIVARRDMLIGEIVFADSVPYKKLGNGLTAAK